VTLVVSRDGVSRTEIQVFDPTTRFIKLPVENYLKLLDFGGTNVWESLNRPQIALINAVNNPDYRFITAALSRRLGKTFIANVIGQLVVLVPNCNVLIMSPNFSLSSISFELQRKLIKTFDIEVAKDNLKDKVIELTNGSSVRMGSLSTVDSCVGRSYNLIIFDEAALGSDAESAFNVSLRPTLDRPGSKAIFISTPRGKNNWFSRFYDRGFSSTYPEWCSLQADYTENERMTEKDVLEARSSMSKAEFEQEYLASFTVFAGQIYEFVAATQVQDWVNRDGIEVIGGLDPGYKDPTAFCVVIYVAETDVFHVVDEYQCSEVTTAEHAAAIGELASRWGVETIFIDSAAAQFAGDLAYTYNIATIKAKKQVLEGIAYVQTIISQNRLFVAPHCTNTLLMLDQYQWDTSATLTRERPVHDNTSHMADALRYALYTYTI
jgi:hypothetical protein